VFEKEALRLLSREDAGVVVGAQAGDPLEVFGVVLVEGVAARVGLDVAGKIGVPSLALAGIELAGVRRVRQDGARVGRVQRLSRSVVARDD
jgi:hypothetical protein